MYATVYWSALPNQAIDTKVKSILKDEEIERKAKNAMILYANL